MSSTFEDLKAERAIVLNAAAAVGAPPTAMEHYGAADRRPLEMCVADVRASDLYVGIIGWRYGFVPAGSQISITEAEFNAATEVGIPRLIYFTNEQLRPATCTDDDPVVHFRARVSQQPLVRKVVKNGEDLATHVALDMEREVLRLSSRKDPDQFLLPYLCDREPQTTAVGDYLSSPGPPICLLYGAVNQTPLKYLACLRSVHLPGLVGAKPGTTRELNLPWPPGAVSAVARALRVSLARRLELDVRLEPAALEQAVREKLGEHPGPVLVSFQAPKLDELEEDRLQAIVAYFKAWPAQSAKPELIVISSSYEPTKPNLLTALGLQRRDRAERAASNVASKLTAFADLRVLPELSNVKEGDARAWIDRSELARLSLERNLEQEVAQIFSKRKELPMADLAPRLLEILTRAPGRSGAE